MNKKCNTCGIDISTEEEQIEYCSVECLTPYIDSKEFDDMVNKVLKFNEHEEESVKYLLIDIFSGPEGIFDTIEDMHNWMEENYNITFEYFEGNTFENWYGENDFVVKKVPYYSK